MNNKQIAIIGTGVIGNGWIVRFLANGFDVVAYDPIDGAEARTKEVIEQAWESVESLGLHTDASHERIRFVSSIEDAVKHADLIQENVPERLDLKQDVLKEIDRFAQKDAIIGSSTSGIKPTELQIKLDHPERLVVAHPFNPVYLLPLVEIVGGKQTTKEMKQAAHDLYEAANMKPMIIEKEIEGFVADRLMEALWREALHLVNDGIATTEEVDKAITYGAGLRWAQMGPFMTFHLAGGKEGMRHMLKQFGPALKLPWTKLEAPELTEDLKERVINGCETHAGDRSVAELEHKRNAFLVQLIDLVEDYWP
ncbi:carnitine 3-dehydrogenase [Pelagirhabdus alkalitolerans]|uniref:L-carnitine dehydrogenase n=1 Tax=Pelagirhabdus alkalitolerans TaxID=1612202 RepID=A0A1G6JRM2_9BACI|nr:3-hydroxyacyl-CoA dehydrogenase NAD-binding domain-containing protein [Pelagirhabdus alkalitolerans]SDC21337.1 carnitine 3-dehydrogenase [Pelagirhabdus alkalitolerans]